MNLKILYLQSAPDHDSDWRNSNSNDEAGVASSVDSDGAPSWRGPPTPGQEHDLLLSQEDEETRLAFRAAGGTGDSRLAVSPRAGGAKNSFSCWLWRRNLVINNPNSARVLLVGRGRKAADGWGTHGPHYHVLAPNERQTVFVDMNRSGEHENDHDAFFFSNSPGSDVSGDVSAPATLRKIRAFGQKLFSMTAAEKTEFFSLDHGRAWREFRKKLQGEIKEVSCSSPRSFPPGEKYSPQQENHDLRNNTLQDQPLFDYIIFEFVDLDFFRPSGAAKSRFWTRLGRLLRPGGKVLVVAGPDGINWVPPSLGIVGERWHPERQVFGLEVGRSWPEHHPLPDVDLYKYWLMLTTPGRTSAADDVEAIAPNDPRSRVSSTGVDTIVTLQRQQRGSAEGCCDSESEAPDMAFAKEEEELVQKEDSLCPGSAPVRRRNESCRKLVF